MFGSCGVVSVCVREVEIAWSGRVESVLGRSGSGAVGMEGAKDAKGLGCWEWN